MVREARGKGIELEVDGLEVVHVMHRKVPNGDERIDFFIRAAEWIEERTIMEREKCNDLRWFELKKLPDNMIPYVRQAIDCIRNMIPYTEHGW